LLRTSDTFLSAGQFVPHFFPQRIQIGLDASWFVPVSGAATASSKVLSSVLTSKRIADVIDDQDSHLDDLRGFNRVTACPFFSLCSSHLPPGHLPGLLLFVHPLAYPTSMFEHIGKSSGKKLLCEWIRRYGEQLHPLWNLLPRLLLSFALAPTLLWYTFALRATAAKSWVLRRRVRFQLTQVLFHALVIRSSRFLFVSHIIVLDIFCQPA
jgi:hypothetical protein